MSQETGDLQAKLRVLMDVAAGEPSHRVTMDAVTRGVARRRRAAGAAATAALVLACSAAVAVAAQHKDAGHRTGGPTSSGSRSVTAGGPAGVPRYYLVRSAIPNDGTTGNREVTTVRATTTGALRARIRCPVSAPYVVTWPVAPVSNDNFFLVCQRATGPEDYDKVQNATIFRFHLTTAGLVTGEVPVRGGALGALLVQRIAATPDGSEIAVMVYPGDHPADLHRTPPSVIVIDTRTGRHAIWHGAAPVAGNTVYWPQGISLPADGQELVFLTEPQCFQPGCAVRGGPQMRVVQNPATGGGQLNSSRLLVRLNSVLRLSAATVMAAVISPDGTRLTLAITGALSGTLTAVSFSVVQIPANGGGRPRFVYRLQRGDEYSFFSADPSGGHFLVGTGTPNGPLDGRIVHGRLIPLEPAPAVVDEMVW